MKSNISTNTNQTLQLLTNSSKQTMGHTKTPFTIQYKKERRCFKEMGRGLLLGDDKRLFDEMWNRAEFHIPACEKAAHPLPIISVLLAIDLEQQKAIARLQERLKAQDQEIRWLRVEIKKRDQETRLLKKELESLYNDLEERLSTFREEMLDIKYPLHVT